MKSGAIWEILVGGLSHKLSWLRCFRSEDRPERVGVGDLAVSDRLEGLSWKGYEGQDYENFWTGPGKQYLDELERMIVSHGLPGGDAVVEIGFKAGSPISANELVSVPLSSSES